MRIILLLIFILSSFNLYALQVEAVGEAEINNNEIKAKELAVQRAKWAAVDSSSPAKIKVDTIIRNSQITDEAVKTEMSATIKSYKIISEEKKNNIYKVKILADIEKDNVNNLVKSVSNNTDILVAVYKNEQNNDYFFIEEISSNIVKDLLNKNINSLSYNKLEGSEVSKLITKIDKKILSDIFKDTGYSNILIGVVDDVDLSGSTGYGRNTFNISDGSFSWYLFCENNSRFNEYMLDTVGVKGYGATYGAAVKNMYSNFNKKYSITVASNVLEKVVGINKKSVRVVLQGSNSFNDLSELRNDLKNIPFVLDAVIRDNNVFVDYPDKTYYLGLFLADGGKYTVIRSSANELVIRK